jgi:hypothetical protein
MENNNTAKTIELSNEFWDWLWETDRQSFELIMMRHGELIEGKYKEYERARANKESDCLERR